MRVYRLGSFTRVTVSRDEVEAFAARWPCSGIEYGAHYAFDFASNGDLVDVRGGGADVGEDARAALAQDAWQYAQSRIAPRADLSVAPTHDPNPDI